MLLKKSGINSKNLQWRFNMIEIKRSIYLQRLINRRNNGLIKIITGIRRCGKSYLLDPIFKNYLKSIGVKEDHIIKIEMDKVENKRFYRDSKGLNEYIHSFIKDSDIYYLLLDEIQLVDDFELLLNGLLYEKNIDIYVTGSNSKFLSSDIITEFRGRGDQIKLYPLSFSEFFEAYNGDKQSAWNDYIMYGGMPQIIAYNNDEDKIRYLKDLFDQTYINDIVERNKIKRIDVLDTIINLLASSIGSLTNTQKVYNTFISKGEKDISLNTISSYINYIEDSFIVNKSLRYDLKGKKYISTPSKYYFSDIGLRNARLNFRQLEENHLMENIIYNELLKREYNVDVGVIELREENKRKQIEIDFVCNLGSKRYYIQSALDLSNREKTIQEERPLLNINDNFKKIIIVKGNFKPWYTEEGILILSLFDFLLDEKSLDI